MHEAMTLSRVALFIVTAGWFAAAGCAVGPPDAGGPESTSLPRTHHDLLPVYGFEGTQVAAGAVSGEAPVQPVAFPHARHLQNGVTCEYCHSAARNSQHAGIPELQTCMGCHEHVLEDSPEIKLITAYWERGEPVPWKKVHDLPDFVNFSHKRHVRAGVNCTECHGQVQGMAGVRAGGTGDPATAAPTTAEEAATVLGPAEHTMTREATLQMGWCVNCHASHPSVDTNYGPHADLRRAELKDCTTCHK
jgi:hypothetical protein